MQERQHHKSGPNSRQVPEPGQLQSLLAESAARHQHLCPRQVLGARIGLCGLRALDLINYDLCLQFDNSNKRLLTIVETDGCATDGLAIAVDCSVGRRTLRVLDFGKVAATLIDIISGRAVRVVPSPFARDLAPIYAPEASSRWHAYRSAYQLIPDEELLVVQEVALIMPLAQILSKPDARTHCDRCGEEIINEREVCRAGQTLCRPCAGEAYYRLIRQSD